MTGRLTYRRRSLAGAVAALVLVVAACGDDDGSADTDADASADTSATTEEGESEGTSGGAETTEGETTDGETTDGGDAAPTVTLDMDGDGSVTIGVATPGPRDDGSYYQAMVEGVEAFSAENGYDDPVIVDNIDPSAADAELRNLARQNVDMIAVGAGEIADPLEAVAAEFPDVFWYCNCGSAVPEIPGVAQTRDDSAQISYSAGVATGLLLSDTDSTQAAFLGCCDLDFEKEAYLAFEHGLKSVDDSFTMTYIPTGDFDDAAGGTEAFNQAVAAGAGAVYPFLGGAHETVVGLANEADVITMSAGVSSACESENLDYDIAVQFDAGDYLLEAVEMIAAGELEEGQDFTFMVGEHDFVGAKLCDGTPEQVQALDEVTEQIGNGDFDDLFGEVKAEAYS